MTKLYIAGPMTDYPDFNRPAFHLASAVLMREGYQVVNPATTIPPCADPEWSCWTRASIARMLEHDVDGVALLPGWEGSMGAKTERDLAMILGLRIQTLTAWISAAPAERKATIGGRVRALGEDTK